VGLNSLADILHMQGATPRELVLEACRRNNTDLLQEVIDLFNKKNPKTAEDEIAALLNTARDGIGQGVLHIAAANGNCIFPRGSLGRGGGEQSR
jgi:hypothetical protein